MGFREALDALLGTGRIPEADTERLFAIATARVTMQAALGLEPAGSAALCFRPIDSARAARVRGEIEELLAFGREETGTSYRLETDQYRYTWVVLEDPDFEDLVAGIHLISQTLIERGYGPYLLCAVYAFDGNRRAYWIFTFKRGRYYPFVPVDEGRDSACEFRLRAMLERELPIETSVEEWYPLRGIPL
ncbi:MAG: hypothetical protein GXY82_06900 [Methanospirillum sp.]|nr:hypothetical protein [Methanospirillum sp.]